MQDIIVPPLFSWPPAYTIRLSARAKRVTLSLSPKKGLEVIVPERAKRKPNITNLLEEKRSWIEKNLSYLLQAKKHAEPLIKPYILDLAAIHAVFKFSYQFTDSQNIKIRELDISENSFLVTGPTENSDLVFTALRRWLKLTARKHLSPWIQNLSEETGLHYSKISIRSQSTLWGSCTAAKKISLNNKLLFLPDYLVRYILIHELCHIQHLNHSKRFWDLVHSFDPNYIEHKRLMKGAGRYVPSWVETR